MQSKGMEKRKITDEVDHTEKSDKNADYNSKEKETTKGGDLLDNSALPFFLSIK